MSCGPARRSGCGSSGGVAWRGCGGGSNGRAFDNPCATPVNLPATPQGINTYSESASEDVTYNSHTHDHCHTLHVFNNEQINIHLNEVEHYNQNVDYTNSGVETVCDGNNVSGNVGDFGSSGGFSGYGGPSFEVTNGFHGGSGGNCGTSRGYSGGGGSCGTSRGYSGGGSPGCARNC